MLRWLVQAALNQRVAVVTLALVLIVVSVRILPDTPLNVFPEFAPPLVEVQTEAPGLSTTEVESLVTIPIENALSGIPSIDRLRSRSVLRLSSVVLILAEGTDVMVARQLVKERLATVLSQLPGASGAPVILPPLSATSRVLKIGLSSATLSQMDMTTLARWTIRPRLMAVPGGRQRRDLGTAGQGTPGSRRPGTPHRPQFDSGRRCGGHQHGRLAGGRGLHRQPQPTDGHLIPTCRLDC